MASELTIASATTRCSGFAGARESFATNSLLAICETRSDRGALPRFGVTTSTSLPPGKQRGAAGQLQ
jgi:hypothetical protein